MTLSLCGCRESRGKLMKILWERKELIKYVNFLSFVKFIEKVSQNCSFAGFLLNLNYSQNGLKVSARKGGVFIMQKLISLFFIQASVVLFLVLPLVSPSQEHVKSIGNPPSKDNKNIHKVNKHSPDIQSVFYSLPFTFLNF